MMSFRLQKPVVAGMLHQPPPDFTSRYRKLVGD
jgi:hypothetical protein